MNKTQHYKEIMGQRITFDAVLKGNYRQEGEPGKYYRAKTVLRYDEIPTEKQEGFIAGVRYKREGEKDYIGYEEGWAFHQKNAVKALLVYTHPLQNPILVPFRFADQLTPPQATCG